MHLYLKCLKIKRNRNNLMILDLCYRIIFKKRVERESKWNSNTIAAKNKKKGRYLTLKKYLFSYKTSFQIS